MRIPRENMRPHKTTCHHTKLCSATQNLSFSHSSVDICNQITDQTYKHMTEHFLKKNISKKRVRTKLCAPDILF